MTSSLWQWLPDAVLRIPAPWQHAGKERQQLVKQLPAVQGTVADAIEAIDCCLVALTEIPHADESVLPEWSTSSLSVSLIMDGRTLAELNPELFRTNLSEFVGAAPEALVEQYTQAILRSVLIAISNAALRWLEAVPAQLAEEPVCARLTSIMRKHLAHTQPSFFCAILWQVAAFMRSRAYPLLEEISTSPNGNQETQRAARDILAYYKRREHL